MFELQRADHFLCYVSKSALSLDRLEKRTFSYTGRTFSYKTRSFFLYNIWSGRTFELGGPNIMRHRLPMIFGIIICEKLDRRPCTLPPPSSSSFCPSCDILTIRTCTHVAVITCTCTSEKKIR